MHAYTWFYIAVALAWIVVAGYARRYPPRQPFVPYARWVPVGVVVASLGMAVASH